MTITGQNFGATPAANIVTFLGDETDDMDDVDVMTEDVTVISDTELEVIVPEGALTGPIEVRVGSERATSQTFTVEPLGVSGAEGGLRAYPNPASGSVRLVGLSASRTYTCTIYTLAGRVALAGTAHGSAAIDVSGLARGQYVLVLREEDGSETLRARLAVK